MSYCTSAGVWVTCHQLRHTFARQMTEASTPVTSVQKMLGHARLNTTQLYVDGCDQIVRRDYYAAMAKIMAGSQRTTGGCSP